MNKITDNHIVEILKRETVIALGCTEPVACALATAKCKEVLGGLPDRMELWVSGNIFKNGMGVGIPGTGMVGLPIAAALGAICGHTAYGLEVLKEVNDGDNLARAKELMKRVVVSVKADAPDKLYLEAIACKGEDRVRVVIIHAHTNISYVEKDGEILEQRTYEEDSLHNKADYTGLTVKRIWDFIQSVDAKEIEFILKGAEMNKAISMEGLEKAYGLQIGRTLKESIDKGLLGDDLLNVALIRATAASDARMDGCPKPVMTNSGSGNQGITVYLPVIVTAEKLGSSGEQLIRALALSNLIAGLIHSYVGHLSALCGILIAATGASSAITYLMGGSYEQVVNTIKTMCSNLTGMMCDGAKQGCALKVYSGVSAAIQASLLSMRGIRTNNDGIVEDDIEKTIRNVGVIGTAGMEETDKTILNIMCQKSQC